MMRHSSKVQRDISKIMDNPPRGILCCRTERTHVIEVYITGDSDSPYAKGMFELELKVPERYPMKPPQLKFITAIYHPNVDMVGRICLDLLKGFPDGNWRSSYTLWNLLDAVRKLMHNPNCDEPLMADRAIQYMFEKEEFDKKAEEWTATYALPKELGRKPQPDTYYKSVLSSEKRRWEYDYIPKKKSRRH